MVKLVHSHYGSIMKSMHVRRSFTRFLHILGPGLVTGAADDDPSGIATYSQAGAATGYGLFWMIPFMFPLLLSVQGACSRIGAVTGKGMARIIKENFSKKVLLVLVMLVVIANVVNIGADLGAMASSLQLLFPAVPFAAAAVGLTILILLLEIFVDYKKYAKILKWLAVVLFAYPITAIVVGQPWLEVMKETLTVHISLDSQFIMLMVALLGTTISPYLFFWDTSEVTEDEISAHRLGIKGLHPPKISAKFLRAVRLDNFVGMALAAVTAWFIMLTCATVLNKNGITEINTAADAARALEPLVKGFPFAGEISKFIFSVGVIGIGLLAVPVLAGSSSYAISESLGWKEGLYRKFDKARGFYTVIIFSTLVGLLLNFVGIDPIQALIYAAVVNGVCAVPLLAMIAKIGRDEKIMGDYRIGRLSHWLVWLAFVVMLVASVAMVIDFLF